MLQGSCFPAKMLTEAGQSTFHHGKFKLTQNSGHQLPGKPSLRFSQYGRPNGRCECQLERVHDSWDAIYQCYHEHIIFAFPLYIGGPSKASRRSEIYVIRSIKHRIQTAQTSNLLSASTQHSDKARLQNDCHSSSHTSITHFVLSNHPPSSYHSTPSNHSPPMNLSHMPRRSDGVAFQLR